MMVSNGLILPVDFPVWRVERVCSAHFEDGHVSARGTYLFDVCETDAGLADDQRVCWRRHGPFCHVGLEVVDRCAYKVDIVTPARYDRVGLYPGVSSLGEIVHELNPHVRQTVASFCGRSSDEGVWLARDLAARLLIGCRPIVTLAGWAFSSCEAYFFEEWEGEFFRVYLWHLSYPSTVVLEI